MAKSDLGALLLGLGLLYLVTKNGKSGINFGGRSHIYTYANYVDNHVIPNEPATGSNIPENLKGFKTPATAIKYAPKGAGVVLHSAPRLSGGYVIR